jgi:hypothetical protein
MSTIYGSDCASNHTSFKRIETCAYTEADYSSSGYVLIGKGIATVFAALPNSTTIC